MDASIDLDRPCLHKNFSADVNVIRLIKPDDRSIASFMTEITVRCSDCDEPFRWIGVQAGMMPSHPMCSIDETTLKAPIRPASSDPDFGMGIPGYAISMRQVGDK